MRIRMTMTNRWRIGFWSIVGFYSYSLIYPETKVKYAELRQYSMYPASYEAWKEREQHRWKDYLRRWDPQNIGNTLMSGLGTKTASVVDKMVYGDDKFDEPVPYDKTADEFIEWAEQTGLDPAKPILHAIQSMCDAYYPDDLDPNPEETQRVLQPKLQWIYRSDFEDVVEKEDEKPRPNSLGRYLWFIPGYQEYFDVLKEGARSEEEQMLRSMTAVQRQEFYEEVEDLAERWALELNDYAPLLAHRWDRKLKFSKYIMNPNNYEEMLALLMKPGGVKQVFVKAGIITPQEAEAEHMY